MLLKDNIDTRDRQPTTAGSLALLAAKPARDAFLVSRLRAAGAVVIGKANLSEWANFRSTASSSGWSAVGGQNNNPYVLDRNPCGSSSGSGSGISANLAVVAIGTETDGSIVCPSGQNGVVGIKPTLGLVSRSGVVPISAKQDTAGPMTRHVVDAALTLSVLRGVDPADPATRSSAPYLGVDYLRKLRPGALRGKRIGVWLAGTGVENVPSVAAVMTEATAALTRLGATVVPADLPYQDRIGEPEFAALLVEFKHDLNAYLAARPGRHPRTLAGLIAFNNRFAEIELKYFGQEIFIAAAGDVRGPHRPGVPGAAADGDVAGAAQHRRDDRPAGPGRDRGADERAGVADEAAGRGHVRRVRRLLHAVGGVRLPERHGAGRVRRTVPDRGLLHRPAVRRGRPAAAGVRVRARHPGPPPAGVPADPAGIALAG